MGRSRAAADLILIIVALCWGGSFIVVRDTVASIPPVELIAIRFLLALLAMIAIYPRRLHQWPSLLGPGLILGILLFCGFAAQTYGLFHLKTSGETTNPAGVSGLITGLNVVFVAVLAAVTMRHRFSRRVWLGAGLATVGLLLLSWQGGRWQFGPGSILTLVCAVFFALHIIATGRYAPGRDPVALASFQFAVVFLLSSLASLATGCRFVSPSGAAWAGLAYLALLGTGFAFLMQTAAQRHTPPVDTAVILAAEPLFAVAIAVLLGGEKLSGRILAGGGAILAAVLLATVAAPQKDPGFNQKTSIPRPIR